MGSAGCGEEFVGRIMSALGALFRLIDQEEAAT
jgi:hypothetical protein